MFSFELITLPVLVDTFTVDFKSLPTENKDTSPNPKRCRVMRQTLSSDEFVGDGTWKRLEYFMSPSSSTEGSGINQHSPRRLEKLRKFML